MTINICKDITYVNIWRVEDKSGLGPWITIDRWYKWGHAKRFLTNPTPDKELCGDGWLINKCYSGYMVFGCRSRRMLKRWFSSKLLKALKEKGYTVKRFRVPVEHCHFGESQVVFDKSKSITKRNSEAITK